jgi:hypothetical protein
MSVTVTIGAGESISTSARIPGYQKLFMISGPNTWTPADISFLLSVDGGATFGPVIGAGASTQDGEIIYPVNVPIGAVGWNVVVDRSHNIMQGVVKIRSGSVSDGAVNQVGERTLTLYFQ